MVHTSPSHCVNQREPLCLLHTPHNTRVQNPEVHAVLLLCHVYFATAPAREGANGLGSAAMKREMGRLQEYVAGDGATLASNPDLVKYFALCYAPNPAANPAFKHIFTDS